MMFFDKHLSRPITYAITIWMLIVFMTHTRYFFNGVTKSIRTFNADRKAQNLCSSDPDHRISFAKRCEELDSLTVMTPFWKGWEEVGDNSFLSLTGVSDLLWHSMKSVGAYALILSAVVFGIGLAAYIAFNKIVQNANLLAMQRHDYTPAALSFDTMRQMAIQEWAQFAGPPRSQTKLAEAPPRQLQWTTVYPAGEEVDH